MPWTFDLTHLEARGTLAHQAEATTNHSAIGGITATLCRRVPFAVPTAVVPNTVCEQGAEPRRRGPRKAGIWPPSAKGSSLIGQPLCPDWFAWVIVQSEAGWFVRGGTTIWPHHHWVHARVIGRSGRRAATGAVAKVRPFVNGLHSCDQSATQDAYADTRREPVLPGSV